MHDAVSPDMIRKFLSLSLWTAVVLVLCACGRPEISKTSSRPAAQVTGEESTAPRIDSVLANHAGGQITDQELLAQEALEARLDRDAQVANAIESAKRQILAQAYIERTVISASQPSPEQISRFYEDNPALFKSRRIYRVRELVVAAAPERFGALREAVARAKDLAEVARWLDSRKLPFEAAASASAAEQIPMNVLHRLFEMHDGQIIVFPTPHGASVVRLEETVEAPLNEKQAGPLIARYLLNRKRLELAQAEVTKLRERAQNAKDGIAPVRPANAVQAAARALAPAAGQEVAQNATEFAKLR